MQNDENTNDLEVETKDEETVEDDAVDTVDEEKADADSSTDEDKTGDDELTKAKAEAAKYRRLLEKEQKKNKPNPAKEEVPSKAKQSSPSSLSVEETVLRAQGMSPELLKTLKKVAAINGTSLLDAQKDDLFVAAKDKFEKEEKSKMSSIRPSRGSAKSVEKPTFTKKGLSDDEHKALWEETVR